MADFPQKSIRIRPWEPTSPIALKRARLDAEAITRGSPSIPHLLPSSAAFADCVSMASVDNDIDEPGTRDLLKHSTELEQLPKNLASGLSTPKGFDLPVAGPSQSVHAPTTAGLSVAASPIFPQPNYLYALGGYGPINASVIDTSLATLDAKSHASALARANKIQEGKSTGPTYQRHITRYEKWWNQFQTEEATRNPNHHQVSAFPITATRVSIYLEHESTREKVCNSLFILYYPL